MNAVQLNWGVGTHCLGLTTGARQNKGKWYLKINIFALKVPPLSIKVFLKNNTTEIDLFTNRQNDSSDLTGIDRRKK